MGGSGSELLDELMARLELMPEAQYQSVAQEVMVETQHVRWIPNPGPQNDAFYSEADILLFGGNPGGGKTGLEIGLGLTAHHRTLICRKAFSDLEAVLDTAKRLVGTEVGFVHGARPRYRKPDGGVIHFVGLGDKLGGKQGWDHDLICVDEAAQCTEKEIRMLLGWLRTDRKGQRCRMVLGSNPPLDSTGDWMIKFFGPWLDQNHPNPARIGELRYFLPSPDGGDDVECNKEDTTEIAGVTVHAQSRTYIFSQFTDNPFYDREEYAKSLAGLPPEHREILISGNFMLARKDQQFQVIPTAWVKAAQDRWVSNGHEGYLMTALAYDPAGGGVDAAELCTRYGAWISQFVTEKGKSTVDGSAAAATIVAHRRNDCPVVVDFGGGYGGAVCMRLEDNGIEAFKFNGAEQSTETAKGGKLRFANKRAEGYWRLREELDPDQEGGAVLALPPDPELRADLTSMTWKLSARGIVIESKEDIKLKLGRSPGKGDVVMMVYNAGNKAAARAMTGRGVRSGPGRHPQVVMSKRAERYLTRR